MTCTYCGRETTGTLACVAHRDLLAIDPVFAPDVPQKAEPTEDFRPEALLDRLVTNGG